MPLSAGEKLGPYEIVAPIGAGGMGEVYKARDTRLQRTVAVKVLPSHLAERGEAVVRFEREARAVASLNHPNICTLYDFGPGYMVMELIEGETLAARIENGPIPLEQALAWAGQIGDALDRAHRAGVTHRDVKPGNIMLTRDGVKVLDFGLAKSATAAPSSMEATLTQVLTAEGTVLGTPQYMAPELFEGKEADARADVWAFGAVVHEMVTGRKTFAGPNYSGLVGAILSADPAPIEPAWLDRLTRRCLAKDPDNRYQSMRDVVLDLRTPAPGPLAPVARRPWGWMAAAICLGLAGIAWGAWMRKAGDTGTPRAFDVAPPEGSRFTAVGNGGGSVISPDGRLLAFAATGDKGGPLLYVRPVDSLEAKALPKTDGAGRPFWSPDSKSIGYFADGKVKRVELAGGSPVAICEAVAARGGTWNEDGVILFGDQKEGLQRVGAAGGAPSFVTKVNREAGETFHYYPRFLPGGKKFLYLVRHRDDEKAGIFMGSLDGGPAQRIVTTTFLAAYDAQAERLLYLQGSGTLMARRVVLDPPGLSGDPETVAEGVRNAAANGYAEFSVSTNGTLSYGRGESSERVRFAWRDRTGKLLETVGEAASASPITSFSLSPDGRRVAYSRRDNPDISVLDLSNGSHTRVTFNMGTWPQWSRDGRLIYFANPQGLHRKPADGTGEEELLLGGIGAFRVSSVSPDGKFLLFGTPDIMLLPLSGDRKPEPYLQTKYIERTASFSPDGRWVAYASNESGREEIYVQGFPEKRGKWQVSREGGVQPHWRADGKELYWGGSDDTVLGAKVELKPGEVRVGVPEPLFRNSYGYYQPSLDGQRFLVFEPEGGQRAARPLAVVQNWAARLGK